jgi:hypothetical protein
MRFETKSDADHACHTINQAFSKRGHLQPVFSVHKWAYGWEVSERKVTVPNRTAPIVELPRLVAPGRYA